MRRRWAVVLIGSAALVGLTLWGGWVAVEPGEVVVVRRLGRVLPEPWGPGLHWTWPLGVDRTIRLRPDEGRRRGFGRGGPGGPLDAPGAGEYLSGDLNIVRVRGVVQYRVTDPIA